MAVALICNMNNHFFATARYLRDRGVDAHVVLLDNEAAHFHPSQDCYDRSYQKFSHRVGWGDHTRLTSTKPRAIAKDLERYAFTFGSGASPAFLHYAGLRLDVFHAHGSDIAEMPFFAIRPPRRGALSTPLRFPFHQRRGIAEARYIAGPVVPQIEPLYDRIGVTGVRFKSTVPPLYAPDFEPEALERHYHRSAWYAEFKAIRDRADLVVFHHARQIWSSRATPFSLKGNDKLIRAFARFVEKHPDVRAVLVMFEYGPDVVASRALASELGIESHIEWFPVMARKELMIGASLADIVCGEFSVSWNFGGTIIEGIALGKPLLHYRDDSLYPEDELFPIMNVSTADDMLAALSDYVTRPEHYAALGARAHAWFDEHIIRAPVERLLDLVRSRG